MTKLLVFIPCYNEASHLKEVLARIPTRIEGISVIDLLVIDDGSTDATVEVASSIEGVRVLRNRTNMGISLSFQRGIEYALQSGYDVAVNIDGDGQFSPKEIPALIQPILDGEADFVAGTRFADKAGGVPKRPEHMPLVKYLGNRLGAWILSRLYRQTFSDVTCGFRAYNHTAMLSLNINNNLTYTQESFQILARERLAIVQCPITVTYDTKRKSRVVKSAFGFILGSAIRIIRTFRDHEPLQFFGWLGSLLFVPGVMLDGFLLIHYLNAGRFSPYIFVGFIGAYLKALGILIWVVGFGADMQRESRLNQEKILRMLKADRRRNIPDQQDEQD